MPTYTLITDILFKALRKCICSCVCRQQLTVAASFKRWVVAIATSSKLATGCERNIKTNVKTFCVSFEFILSDN